MSAAAIYACHRQYREAKTALGKLVPTVHEYQSDFYKQFHRQYHRLGIGISRLFSGQSVSCTQLHCANSSEAVLKSLFQSSSNSQLCCSVPKNDDTLQHELSQLQYVLDPITIPLECSPTRYFECCEVRTSNFRRMIEIYFTLLAIGICNLFMK
ncbi:Hypothetical_protein [Hexamita inflata]|uniref:Hypothetical_protein n=1 Tax=Hexamita inflata TaxID=28002 RepID=A0AA86QVG9_9EUKA|nr:Hypothetical protein HINF_LOCUS49931 [Hexamita inflata]